MKIGLQEIKKLIQKQLIQEQLLQEQIFGNLAFVYHGSPTDPKTMHDIIKNKTFMPGKGAGAMYGPGLYTIREFKPDANTFDGEYGSYVYKFKANLAGVVSFDSDVTQQIYGKKLSIIEQIQLIINNNLVDQRKIEVLKKFLKSNENKDFDQKEYNIDYSSLVALKNWGELITVIRGVSFTGENDGPVIVFYSLDGIVPVAWSETGKNKKKEDYEWQPFKIGSQSQNYEYKPFDQIIDEFGNAEKIKKLIKNINNSVAFNLILKIIKLPENKESKIFIINNCYKTIPKEKSDIILEELINDNNINIRQSIYENPGCSPHILKKIRDEKLEIRKDMASYYRATKNLLFELFNDNDDDVSYSAFYNQNFSKEIKRDYDLLSNHKNDKIRAFVAHNPNCPPHILEKLMNDSSESVVRYALNNQNFPKKISTNWELLFNHKNFNIKKVIASNPNCPPDILEKLSYINDLEILESLAKNINCPPDILIKIFDIDNFYIKLAIAKNPNCPLNIVLKIIKEIDSQNLNLTALELHDLKIALIYNKKTWNGVIKKLFKDPNPKIKLAAQIEAKKRGIQLESLRRKISKLIYAVR